MDAAQRSDDDHCHPPPESRPCPVPSSRSAAKRALYREIVDRLAVVGIPPDHVVVMLREISQENWGIRGGQAACDVELGFEVAV